MYSMCLQRYAHPYDFHLKTIQFNDLFSLHKIDQCTQAKIIIYTRFKFFEVCIKHLETIGFDKIVIRFFSWQGM
jgi:hypothetical protein